MYIKRVRDGYEILKIAAGRVDFQICDEDGDVKFIPGLMVVDGEGMVTFRRIGWNSLRGKWRRRSPRVMYALHEAQYGGL